MAKNKPENPGVDPTLARHGGLSYLEIPAVNPPKSAAFYAQLLGWKVDGADSDHPKFTDQTGHLLGRWVTGVPAQEPGLLPYIYVNGLHDIVKRVETLGGQIVKPPYAEGNLWVATIRDPAGNVIGLWTQRDDA
jgi:predicted enzyme related to lactoylglutathione lyase